MSKSGTIPQHFGWRHFDPASRLLRILLIRVAGGVWHLVQLCGPQNAAPPLSMRTGIVCGLTAAGQKIVETDPQSALGRLTQEGGRRRAVAEGDLGDQDDEDGEEDIGGIAA